MHQVRQRDSQRLCNDLNISERQIPLAPLDATHVRAIQTAFGGKTLLRIPLIPFTRFIAMFA